MRRNTGTNWRRNTAGLCLRLDGLRFGRRSRQHSTLQCKQWNNQHWDHRWKIVIFVSSASASSSSSYTLFFSSGITLLRRQWIIEKPDNQLCENLWIHVVLSISVIIYHRHRHHHYHQSSQSIQYHHNHLCHINTIKESHNFQI